jgi:hypothetical protein
VAGLDGLRVVGVACGTRHTLCVTESGLVYVWGANEAGQLGQGDFLDRSAPARVRHEEWNGDDARADANASGDSDHERSRVFELQERLLGPLRGANARFIPHGEINRAFAQPTALQLETAALRREARLGIRREEEESEAARRVADGLAPSRPKKYPVVAAVGGERALRGAHRRGARVHVRRERPRAARASRAVHRAKSHEKTSRKETSPVSCRL